MTVFGRPTPRTGNFPVAGAGLRFGDLGVHRDTVEAVRNTFAEIAISKPEYPLGRDGVWTPYAERAKLRDASSDPKFRSEIWPERIKLRNSSQDENFTSCIWPERVWARDGKEYAYAERKKPTPKPSDPVEADASGPTGQGREGA